MKRPGFTLIELLLVVAIIGILAGIVIVAINPSLQLAKARNARRQGDINAILNAFSQFTIENNGLYQGTVPADCAIPLTPAPARKLCTITTSTSACDFGAPGDGNGCAYSLPLTTFIVSIPEDPQDATGSLDTNQVDYTALLTHNGKSITVSAPNTDIPAAAGILSVTR